jgi:hypothetical protein
MGKGVVIPYSLRLLLHILDTQAGFCWTLKNRLLQVDTRRVNSVDPRVTGHLY